MPHREAPLQRGAPHVGPREDPPRGRAARRRAAPRRSPRARQTGAPHGGQRPRQAPARRRRARALAGGPQRDAGRHALLRVPHDHPEREARGDGARRRRPERARLGPRLAARAAVRVRPARCGVGALRPEGPQSRRTGRSSPQRSSAEAPTIRRRSSFGSRGTSARAIPKRGSRSRPEARSPGAGCRWGKRSIAP